MWEKKYIEYVEDLRKMKLSIIIPTRNRAEYLEQTLKSLLDQTMPQNEYEVIVIDNGSTDRTKEVCQRYKKRLVHFKYIYERRPGLHVGRNRGLIEAESDNLLFADDDVIGTATWVEGIIESLESEDIVLVGGNVIPKFEDKKPVWFDDFLIREGRYSILAQLSVIWTDCGEVEYVNPFYIFGCNFGIKRVILEECGGFHPDGMPKQLLMYRGDGESYVSQYIIKNRYKAAYNPKATVYHVMPVERTTEKYLEDRGMRDGVSGMYALLRESGLKQGFKAYISLMNFNVQRNKYREIYYRAVRKGKRYLFYYYLFYPQIREWVTREQYTYGEGKYVPTQK